MSTMKTKLNGTLATVMTSWKNQHTQWVLRHMTKNFLNKLMANLEDADASAPQVYSSASRSFKKRVSSCLVSRVPEAIFLLLALVLFGGLAQPSTDRQPAKSRGKGKKGKRKGKSSWHKGG